MCIVEQSYRGHKHAAPEDILCGPRCFLGNFQTIYIYVAKCLEKGHRKIIESNLSDIQQGFRPSCSNTDHTSLSSKILRNLGSMLKTSSHALSTLRNHTTRFLVKSLGECCVCMVLTATCYWPPIVTVFLLRRLRLCQES